MIEAVGEQIAGPQGWSQSLGRPSYAVEVGREPGGCEERGGQCFRQGRFLFVRSLEDFVHQLKALILMCDLAIEVGTMQDHMEVVPRG